MRTEEEMMRLILDIAKADERIRAVYLNGSRTNPNVPKDIFQDYDIVYLVKETKSFIQDEKWIEIFGEILYMQKPEALDAMIGECDDLENCYGYLVQLADGNRVDLHLKTVELCKQEVVEDGLTIILLDKDGVLPQIDKPTDKGYWVQKPTQAQYTWCCNEFWWVLNNVTKGLWREEIPYAMDMINHNSRPQLMQMLTWYAGIQTDFSCSVGKNGKYMQRYLPQSMWETYLGTYSTAEIPKMWEASFTMCQLFHEVAIQVGQALGLKYDAEEAKNSLAFLMRTSKLPKTAKEINVSRS